MEQLHTIINIPVVGALLLRFEFEWVLAILSEELADALLVIAGYLVIVSEA